MANYTRQKWMRICLSQQLEEKTERNFKYRQRNTNSDSKQTNVLGNKKPLKTDKTKNIGDNTKEDDSENSKEKLKDISNIDKETYK